MRTVKPLLLVAAAMATIITSCSPPPKVAADETVPTLKGPISKETALRLVTNYNGRANHITKDKVSYPDARCVWFSLPQLQDMIKNIEAEHGDGIRFYLAAYDKTMQPDLKNINPAYLDYTTLVMVSTKFDSVARIHNDYYTNTKGLATSSTTDPQNQGELCPPPEKCDSRGAHLLIDSSGVKK